MGSPENVHVLWWLVGFSYFIHLLAALVGIWDRLRMKPGVVERLAGFVDWIQYNKDRATVDARLDGMVTRPEMDKSTKQLSDRLDGLHASIKEEQKTTQGVLRDLIKELGILHGKTSGGRN